MQIIVLVDKEGATQTVVKGAKGKSCVKATEFLHSALCITTQDIPTEDYYEQGISEINTIQQSEYAQQNQEQYQQNQNYIYQDNSQYKS